MSPSSVRSLERHSPRGWFDLSGEETSRGRGRRHGRTRMLGPDGYSNLAVDFEALDKNRLRRLPVPTGITRVRILDASDLHKLRKVASEPVWRAIIADLQTGLRVNKLIESHAEWIVQKGDGYWLYPSPGRSVIKGSRSFYRSTNWRSRPSMARHHALVDGFLNNGRMPDHSRIVGNKQSNGQDSRISSSTTSAAPSPPGSPNAGSIMP